LAIFLVELAGVGGQARGLSGPSAATMSTRSFTYLLKRR
jgi:hypothetical protein